MHYGSFNRSYALVLGLFIVAHGTSRALHELRRTRPEAAGAIRATFTMGLVMALLAAILAYLYPA